MASIGNLILLACFAFWTASAAPLFNFCLNRPVPWTLDNIKPELKVYTRTTTDITIIKTIEDTDTFAKKLVAGGVLTTKRPVTFIVHGFLGYTNASTWLPETKDALLKIEDSVVIIVGWPNGAHVFYNYGIAASNTQTPAAVIAQLSQDILKSSVFNGDKDLLYIHCIGHSLGAHVCGQAGRTSQLFDRITGLDPAGPGFEDCPGHLNVDKDSATCVDNIHTDGTIAGHWNPFVPYFGTLSEWGHIDFYPNGGGGQPGCANNDLPGCSHGRAIELFYYTLTERAGVCMANQACKGKSECDNHVQLLGYFSSCHRGTAKVKAGSFQVTTDKKGQYC